MKYILYKADGSWEVLERQAKMEYEELSKLVGGYIEFSEGYEGAEGHSIMLNENGISEGLKENPFFTPLYQESFLGDIVEGRMDDEGEFIGVDETLPHIIRVVKELNPILFEKDKITTIIGIGDMMAQTTRSALKTVGRASEGNPVFKDAKKGARRMFTLRNLEKNDVMLFEGSDLPFTIDGEKPDGLNGGFTSSTIRGNALYNFHGDIDRIREFVKKSNINPFFTKYDHINHIDAKGTETLVFMDRFASSKTVADRQEGQLKREGHNVKVGVGFAMASK